MTRLHAAKLDVRRLAEASAWRARLSEDDAESSAAFEAWLAVDAANQRAWAAVQAGWTAVGEAATSPQVMSARRDALHRARRQRQKRTAARGTGLLGLATTGTLAAAACAGIVALMTSNAASTEDYRTELGERETATLSDGSRITLDSGSDVQVRYTPAARRLELRTGQARFDVAHEAERPFTVRVGQETVTATGTAFDVDLLDATTRVTLIHGRVTVNILRPDHPLAIAPRGSADVQTFVLTAGEQLIDTPPGPPRIEAVSPAHVDAWRNGQLVFDDESLASVAERVSRYAPHPVTVDASVASDRISGVFDAGDISTFVDTVTHYLPVEALDEPDGSIKLRRRA